MAYPLTLDYLRSRRDQLAAQYQETSVVQRTTDAALTLGSAFGFAFLQAKYPKLEKVGPVDTAILAGTGMLALGLFGGMIPGAQLYGPWFERAASVGSGILSVYAVKLGAHLGDKANKTEFAPYGTGGAQADLAAVAAAANKGTRGHYTVPADSGRRW